MGVISFFFFQCKTAFNVNTRHVISNISQLLPLFDVDHLKMTNCSNLTTAFYPLGNFGQALCIRSCHEDLILTRKSHNCPGIELIQGDSAGGSKLIEQTLRYTHIKVTRAKGYFTHDINGGGDNMYTADDICKMTEFLIDVIFVQFGGRLFRQVVGIPVGTNCAPLLPDLFLYPCENDVLNNMIRSGHRRLARSFNLCYRYTDDLTVLITRSFWIILKR